MTSIDATARAASRTRPAFYLILSLVSNLLIGRVEAWSRRGMPSLKESR